MGYRLVKRAAEELGDRRTRRRMRRRIAARRGLAVLPTLFTLGNLLCGFFAIFLATRPQDAAMPLGWTPQTFAAVFIFLGMVCDGLDGRLARLARATSELGEQLDSMADMVTFGVAPAIVVVQLVGVQTPFLSDTPGTDSYFDRAALIVAAIYVACAAMRLARFNVEVVSPAEHDHMSFKGLPSPGAAGTVASLVLLHEHFLRHLDGDAPRYDPWVLGVSAIAMVAVTMLAAVAMVSRLRYVHVINRYVRGRAPFDALATALIIVLLLLIHPQAALAGAFVLYALSAPVARLWPRRPGR